MQAFVQKPLTASGVDTFLKLVAAEEIDPSFLVLPGSVGAVCFPVHRRGGETLNSLCGLKKTKPLTCFVSLTFDQFPAYINTFLHVSNQCLFCSLRVNLHEHRKRASFGANVGLKKDSI